MGKYGGTFAHKDIAFEFGMWISPEFKLYLIKEFQRLKEQENKNLSLEWNATRFLAKINYKVHTDAVKENLIPPNISKQQIDAIYADEADILNMAMFGMTAKQWRDVSSKTSGVNKDAHRDISMHNNIRDHASITQLICLAGLESINAEFIRQGLTQGERLTKLNQIAIIQMKSLISTSKNLI